MARATQLQWHKAILLREAGNSFGEIQRKTGISKSTLHGRFKKHGVEIAASEIKKAISAFPESILYLITADGFNGIYKIGITADIDSRIKSIQTGCPYKVFVYKSYVVTNALAIEQALHSFFKKKRLEGEWFRLGDTDLSYIDEALQDG